jgi:hypothetical protein
MYVSQFWTLAVVLSCIQNATFRSLHIGMESTQMVLIGDPCCVGSISHVVAVVAGIRRQRHALSIGLNWVGSTWRRRQSPVSETSWMVDGVQNCDTYWRVVIKPGGNLYYIYCFYASYCKHKRNQSTDERTFACLCMYMYVMCVCNSRSAELSKLICVWNIDLIICEVYIKGR